MYWIHLYFFFHETNYEQAQLLQKKNYEQAQIQDIWNYGQCVYIV